MKKYVPAYRVALVRDGRVKQILKKTDNPTAVAALVRAYIGPTAKEHFVVLLMAASSAVIGINTVSVGTLTASLVHPRETFQAAILASAAGVIVAHNHPSGNLTLSHEDKATMRRLADAGRILEYRY